MKKFIPFFLSTIILLFCTSLNSEKYDYIIKNGKIVDGTGNPWYKADIGITDGIISEIGKIFLTRLTKNPKIGYGFLFN